MIALRICLPNQPVRHVQWEREALTMGRAAGNDLTLAVENISSNHLCIRLEGGHYILRDLGSTNGTVLWRGTHYFTLDGNHPGLALEAGDRVCPAHPENQVLIDLIDTQLEEEDPFERTILAEQQTREDVLEQTLSEDAAGLQCVVRLARELATVDTAGEIARLTGQACLHAFTRARAAYVIGRAGGGWRIDHTERRAGDEGAADSRLLRSQRLIERCQSEGKGFLFLFERDRMRVMATMVQTEEVVEAGDGGGDRIILCVPLPHQGRCHGFIEVEAPLAADRSQVLGRRDLALATLIGHLVAARLHDLENQRERLALARKATAGYLAATVGHCFKNLLFVPMSINQMLPRCIKNGQMKEVEWMLARNGVNIRYLDMLSHEFAAASKDPGDGFGWARVEEVLSDAAELVNQIAPDKVVAEVDAPEGLPELWCHRPGLLRLVMNLVLNAVDAIFAQNGRSGPGRIVLRAGMEPARGELAIVIQDDGPGMSPEILGRLREIFRRVQASADALAELQTIAESVQSSKEQGLKEHYGIGFLFVCQTIQQHRGRLAIESEPGEGSCFVIGMPTGSPNANAPAATAG